ncbi:MAG TPA: class I SAM-dependent methyltransferase [Candidatus Krumholzibacteria bacterium]|nr:class I SAM-dependent methyltransferase [Candidatus Krumholzibacteria bacterium]
MKRSSEKRHWDRFWATSPGMEDTYANDGRLVAYLVSRLDVRGKRVLEVGAGTGRDSLELASRGAEVWTLDYSDESLSLMRGVAGDRIRIVCGDALALPFRNGCFDIVFHQGLLEHFRQPLDLLSENHRVLRSGGCLLVDVPQRYHYYTAMKRALMAVDRWFAGWETEFSAGELRALMEEAGFRVDGMYGENLFPPVWYRGVRRTLLKAGVRLPMHPLSSPAMTRARVSLRNAVPLDVRLATSMVIGCLGWKA